MKAVIGITSRYKHQQDKTTIETNDVYIDAVVQAGGIPLIIPMIRDEIHLGQYIDLVDGIIFSGGEDMLPANFNEEPLRGIGSICVHRDRQELALLDLALEASLPILGICRGLQVLNVGLGGSLYQDLASQKPESLEHVSLETVDYGFHNIDLLGEGFLGQIFKKDKILVNSLHHQAIKDLGQGLRSVAYAGDGIVEAVEAADGRPIYGVQFHPERMIARRKEFLKVFHYFIGKCGQVPALGL